MTTEKNVYQKVQEVRVKLQEKNLKKTGKNTYSGFTYYELGDFLPQLNVLMAENGLTTIFRMVTSRKVERAVLEVINSVKPEEKMTFTLPTAEVEIGKKKDGSGGAEPIQNLGGKTTYMRRYMLMIAFEIVESDYVDKNPILHEIPNEEIDDINSKDTVEEINEAYRILITKYDKSYHKSIITACANRKKAITTK